MSFDKFLKRLKALWAEPQVRRDLALAAFSLAGGIVLALWWTAAPPPAPHPVPGIREPATQQPAVPPAPQKQTEAPPLAPPAPEATPEPTWKRNAVALAAVPQAPMIAIVLDDMGVNRHGTERAMALPAPITFAFLPYAHGVETMAATARAQGHELLVHVPMEPKGPADPGPHALRTGETPAEIGADLTWALGRFPGYVGINNHMGSKFTADASAMRLVMQELQTRGLMFLDSRTGADTQAANMAREVGVPVLSRDVFLDNDEDGAEVKAQFSRLEKLAREHGAAVAIGHPHPETLTILEKWIPEAKARGFTLVPLTAIVKRHQAT
ncbi:MAG: divergent polysaccharide deacetylase family protein [Parvibaculum sp.]|uniref:divergent polysaccharide deacetylase family protein n=1 Tax=Parvibaculum sp. TaxID=2024848 RepID=UPI0025DA6BBC|nr:divergent polysaccharide deacetylase family protein [Parvibaculum sp.]MCE9651439.1 divergent polysaccharide deacetylase family protein [Parvibaculum sp.]